MSYLSIMKNGDTEKALQWLLRWSDKELRLALIDCETIEQFCIDSVFHASVDDGISLDIDSVESAMQLRGLIGGENA